MDRVFLVAAALLVVHQQGTAFLGGSSSPSIQQQTPKSPITLRSEGEGKASTTDRVQLKVLTPEGFGIKEAVSEVVLPSTSGQLGVLANHAPMMTALDIGVLRFKQGGKWKPLVLMGGFASVESNQLSILVNDITEVKDIDLDEAKTAMESATAALEKAESKKEKFEATQTVKKAAARLQAAMFDAKK